MRVIFLVAVLTAALDRLRHPTRRRGGKRKGLYRVAFPPRFQARRQANVSVVTVNQDRTGVWADAENGWSLENEAREALCRRRSGRRPPRYVGL